MPLRWVSDDIVIATPAPTENTLRLSHMAVAQAPPLTAIDDSHAAATPYASLHYAALSPPARAPHHMLNIYMNIKIPCCCY